MKNKGKLIIYWDYELQKGADTSTKGYCDGIEDYYQTDFVLKLLNKHKIKTCFAVLGYAAQKGDLPYHAPNQIRQMAEEGHEVGSHTQNHKRISTLNYTQLIDELRQSKENIEKVSKTKCVSFVPPWDKPQFFFNMPIDFKPNSSIPQLSRLSYNQICIALKKSGYKTYRVCPLTSRFNKFKLSNISMNKSITTIPCRISNGFTLEAKKIVQKAIKQKGLAVIYAHPRGLAHLGSQNKKYFENFISYINKQIENKKLKIVLPQEIAETTQNRA